MLRTLALMAIAVWPLVAAAQTAPTDRPYAGEEQRDIKALSTADVQGYLAGKGMGLAKAAELNHYPGPAHVLELAPKLGLSGEQTARTRAIFAAMQKDAVRHGAALVARERELDRLFATGVIRPGKLRAVLDDVGRLQAELRRVHLQAHLDQRAVLTDEQVRHYDALRGYGSAGGEHAHGEHAH
jgi:Spy/CpxP family protein refolding chaperone